MLLPLAHGVGTVAVRSRFDMLRSLRTGSLCFNGNKLLLECSLWLCIVTSFKNSSLCSGWWNLPPGRCCNGLGRVSLKHPPLLRWLILLLCYTGLGSRPFCALDNGTVRRVGGVRNAGQRSPRTSIGHSDEWIVWRWRYEYSSCHS